MMTNGVGDGIRPDLSHAAPDVPAFTQACPVCDWTIWKAFGVRARLWIHQPPFVEACALDGCALRPWVPGHAPPTDGPQGRRASTAKIAFARDVVALNLAAKDPVRLVASLRDDCRGMSLLSDEGRLREALLVRFLYGYMRSRYQGTALERITVFPYLGHELREFLHDPSRAVPSHFVTLLHAFLRDARKEFSGATPVDDTPVEPARWTARSCEPPLPAEACRQREPLPLLNAGMSPPTVARHCGMTPQQVWVLVTSHGISKDVREARRAVILASARSAWAQVCARHVGQPLSVLRRLQGSLYAWLKRKDPEWLATSQYGVTRAATTRLPEQAAVLSAANVLAVIPHLERATRGIREQRIRAKQPQTIHYLAKYAGLPVAQLEARCAETPELDREVRRLLQAKHFRPVYSTVARPVHGHNRRSSSRRDRHA
ncbi:TnsD family Tn7-like transposition protein [Cupriavidus necator]